MPSICPCVKNLSMGAQWRIARRSVICPCKAAEGGRSMVGSHGAGHQQMQYLLQITVQWVAVLEQDRTPVWIAQL